MQYEKIVIDKVGNSYGDKIVFYFVFCDGEFLKNNDKTLDCTNAKIFYEEFAEGEHHLFLAKSEYLGKEIRYEDIKKIKTNFCK